MTELEFTARPDETAVIVDRLRQIMWGRRPMPEVDAVIGDRLMEICEGRRTPSTTDLHYACLLGNVSLHFLTTGELTTSERVGRFRARGMDEDVPQWAAWRAGTPT